MELRIIRYFLAVAEEESISRAADILHLTQPTLSKQLKELEDELGAKLLFRGNRGVTLTDKGHLFRKRAQELVDLADKTALEFASSDNEVSGEIYFGCGETDAFRLIAKTAIDFSKRYPAVKYNLFSGNADDVTEKLDKGLLDFGVLIGFVNPSKYDYIKFPITDAWGLLSSTSSPLAALDCIRPSDLRGVPLIVSKQAHRRNELRDWLCEETNSLNIIAFYNLIFNAAMMVKEGLGNALCLERLVDTSVGSELCFIPFSPKLESEIYLVWRRYQALSEAAKRFLDCLQAAWDVKGMSQ
ncbi:MAG: LysR family transcriptional regulator [Clostridiales bacterium]|jgi:DNA-binding transcriptional LysR family regulator|nr:LysR family transcriptional regulator [Clostridiales bacterium]